MKFLIDKEVDLKKQDFLNTSSYSKTLREVINSSPKNDSFTIGLFGEWGSGKSSIIRTLEEEFRATKKFKFVIYDSWKYSNDSFRRMFLLKLQNDLGFDKTEKFESFYRNKTSDLSINRKIEWKFILITFFIFVLGFLFILYLPNDKTEYKITITVIVAFLGILINAIGRAFNDYKVTIQEPMIFAPEQFEECFNEMISRLFDKGIKHKLLKWIKGDQYVSGIEKLVIVIDNIDRCPKDKAYEMITNIKSFLSTQNNVVFIVPVDDEALKRHIIKDDNNDTKEAEEFLRKFFNVTIRIKPFKRFDLYDFTNKLNKDNGLNFNPTTIDIISKEYATNPRRIIQFFNDLLSELKFFELNQGLDFIYTNESLICKMLVIRQEWPDYYKIVSKNAFLLNDPDETIKDILEKNLHLSSFLKLTESITKNEKISVIEKVLSTFDRESKLPTELISFIDKKAILEIEKIVTNKGIEIEELVDFLIERLNTGFKRKTYKTEVNNIFELICSLNLKFKLNKTQNQRIETEVVQNLSHFFKFISNIELTISYGHILKNQGLSYLDDFFIKYFENTIKIDSDEESFQFAKNIFRLYIKNFSSIKSLKSLSNLFETEYYRTGSKLDDYELESDQLREIVNEQIIEIITSKITEISSNDVGYKEIVYASSNIDFSNISFKTIISRFNDIMPSFNNWSKEEVINFIGLLNNFLSPQHNVVSSDLSEKKVFSSFKSALLSDRTFHRIQINLFKDELTLEEVTVLSNFLKYIYVCSNNNVEILKELQQLIVESENERQEIINMQLIELKDKYNYSLISLKDVILNDISNSPLGLGLFEYIATRKDTNDYSLEDSFVYTKLEKIVNSFILDVNNQIILDFLRRIIKDIRAKFNLILIISKLTTKDILKLPEDIQVLSFDKILEVDVIYDFENQVEFLKAIASKGEKTHINKLILVIIRKLTKNDKVEEGIEILSELKNLKDVDTVLIERVINSIDNKEYREIAKGILKSLK